MILLRKITFNYTLLIFVGFIALHLALLNVNVAEWGDSYKILRAGESIRKFGYPENEKRPPFFSFVLSFHPQNMDPVLFGRIVMLVFSALSLVVFYKLVSLLIAEEKYRNLALLLFGLNPVYLYWSLRIMADTPFSFLVMCVIYLQILWRERPSVIKSLIIGLLAGLCVLTRFEGYLLFAAAGVGFLGGKRKLTEQLKFSLLYVIGFLLVVLPYFIIRNPLRSSYFEEPSGRIYDLKMLWVYIASLVFVFGIVPAFYFIAANLKQTREFFVRNVNIGVFVCLELLLILVWPAALPRLFVAILPYLVLSTVLAIRVFFEKPSHPGVWSITALCILMVFYGVSQYFLKLQFLVLPKNLFYIMYVFQVLLCAVIFLRRYRLFVVGLALSLAFWSYSAIWLHRDVFSAVKNGSRFVASAISGNVAFNDVSGVAEWYLITRNSNPRLNAFYYNFEKNSLLEQESLVSRGVDFLFITNEHNPDLEIDLNKRPYLEKIREFRYNVNNGSFFSQVVKVSREKK